MRFDPTQGSVQVAAPHPHRVLKLVAVPLQMITIWCRQVGQAPQRSQIQQPAVVQVRWLVRTEVGKVCQSRQLCHVFIAHTRDRQTCEGCEGLQTLVASSSSQGRQQGVSWSV